ncbi:carboxymuconolactone decarboxylase family protein [Fictibacillus enclensis]|uniref:carboxymuconolactone decarboxylase family protein n=1 Tax=Fictibacillus enclensis TaxID=1017270 RepID=UPI0025A22E37|nr:carboxymuconolactone decarboxylase family protein [Fictibacillus enclensis]MDM5339528.1 carboxymuconolactone decarboxylase family protein [Fictibacillus enclensis]
MATGLSYFKEVYDVVPGWVQKMHDYRPAALDHYTSLRSDIMQDGALSRKEKDILLVGMNAARLYERSMIYHTKGALDYGATLSELAEYLIVPYLYNGNGALKTGVKSLEYALSLKDRDYTPLAEGEYTTEELMSHMIGLLGNEDSAFAQQVLNLIREGEEQEVESFILSEAVVAQKLKHILMTGIYITELKGKQAGEWMEKARECGATEEELADTGFICLLTAGIPAWFEASDSLTEIKG